MKRFRISQNDILRIAIFHKGNLIIPTILESFKNLEEIKYYCLEKLPWNYKGYGKRIEIEIYNITQEKIKYINTFS
jgi:hypothetical protein